MSTTEPIRDKNQIQQLLDYYLHKRQIRNYLLVIMGVHTALRISDLLSLRWSDVYDFSYGNFRSHIHLIEQKTKKSKNIAINKQIIVALNLYQSSLKKVEADEFLFSNNRDNQAAISRVQAYRIISEAARHIGISGKVSCHSLRKTFGYHAWKDGVPVIVIMDIYNHNSFEVTRRYLGVSQDDKDQAYLAMKFV
jgi:integrase